jgi:hypothetical protein
VYIIPHQRHFEFAFFSCPTNKALSGVLGRYASGHTCITCVAKSKTGPQGDASHTLRSRRASVWYFFHNFLILNIFGTPLYHDSLLDECLSESMGYLYFFLLLFFISGHLSTHCFIYSDTFVSIFFYLMPLGMDFLFSFF